MHGPVSTPTSPRDEWQDYPHLCNKSVWKELMGTAAGLFDRCFPGVIYECVICRRDGHGMQADFGQHVAGPYHFKALWRIGLPDGVKVSMAREGLWQLYLLPDGGIRFNHADGVIEMCRGTPPRAVTYAEACNSSPSHENATGLALQPMPSSAIVDPQSPIRNAQAVLTPMELKNENERYIIADPGSYPTSLCGDWRAYPHLSSRQVWRTKMREPARIICSILERQPIPVYIECSLCERSRGFEEHFPAEGHLRKVWEILQDNVCVKDAREKMWQQWNIKGGGVRINLADGVVEMWRSEETREQSQPLSSLTNLQLQHPSETPSCAPCDAQDHVLNLCMELWKRCFTEDATRVEMILEQVPAEQRLCQVCNNQFKLSDGHLLSKEHVHHVAGASARARSQEWKIHGTTITLKHYPLHARMEVVWKRHESATGWVWTDGKRSFFEHTLEMRTPPEHGVCYYHQDSGTCFVADTGLDVTTSSHNYEDGEC